MFSPSTPRHSRRTMCTAPLCPAAPCSPLPRALRSAPRVPFRIHPFRPHWRFTSLCVSPRLASASRAPPLLPLSRSLSAAISSPRRSRSRCNERCTLLSSCSRRRCFYSAAQSVSVRMPARFARRFASVARASASFGMARNPHGKKLKNLIYHV